MGEERKMSGLENENFLRWKSVYKFLTNTKKEEIKESERTSIPKHGNKSQKSYFKRSQFQRHDHQDASHPSILKRKKSLHFYFVAPGYEPNE